MRIKLYSLAACVALSTAATAHAQCANSVAQLRVLLQDPVFPLAWEETGMDDARPLLVTMDDRGGRLFISFVKAGEGMMAEGPARVCQDEHRLQAWFVHGGLEFGPAATWLLKGALNAGAAVSLKRTAPAQLRIGTPGWTGNFVPGWRNVGLRTTFGAY